MGFNTKLRFNCAKFWQNSNDIIELSGSTSIGTAQYLESLTGVTALTIPTVEWVTGQTGAIDANNGLTRAGNYITLGGSLTGDTTISGAHTLALNPFTFDVTATNINLTGIVNVTGNTNLNDNLTVDNDTHLGGSLGVTGATNLDNCLTVATAISGNTTLDILGATTLHNTLNVTNQTTIGGALTLCTHSAGSTSNPIMVLDGDVVKCVAASNYDVTAVNGLCAIGNEVKLGGTLTGNTTLNQTLYNQLIVCSQHVGDGVSSYMEIDSYGYDFIVDTTGGTSVQQYNYDDEIQLIAYTNTSACAGQIGVCVDGSVNVCSYSGLIYCDRNSSGNRNLMQYAIDYSVDMNNPRIIPDIGFVTGQTTTSGVQTANNGLTKFGTNVTLGGALTGNTTISGAHTLTLNSLTAFNATATNIGLTGIVTATGAVHATSTLGITGATQIGGTLGVTGALTTTTTAQICGALTLSSVATGDVGTDEVMLITSGGVVKKVAASTLGEDNNIYSKTTYTSSQTLTTGSSYVILVNHSVPMTITLPATPLEGQAFKIKDVSSGGALTNNITIGRNGKDMDRTASNALINTDSGALELVYDSALGWFTLAFVN